MNCFKLYYNTPCETLLHALEDSPASRESRPTIPRLSKLSCVMCTSRCTRFNSTSDKSCIPHSPTLLPRPEAGDLSLRTNSNCNERVFPVCTKRRDHQDPYIFFNNFWYPGASACVPFLSRDPLDPRRSQRKPKRGGRQTAPPQERHRSRPRRKIRRKPRVATMAQPATSCPDHPVYAPVLRSSLLTSALLHHCELRLFWPLIWAHGMHPTANREAENPLKESECQKWSYVLRHREDSPHRASDFGLSLLADSAHISNSANGSLVS